VIRRCWDIDPDVRPDFNELSHLLGQLMESGDRQYYVDLNDPYERMNAELGDETYIMMRNPSEGYTSMDFINYQLLAKRDPAFGATSLATRAADSDEGSGYKDMSGDFEDRSVRRETL
jgi:hypothetical protein